MVTLLLPILGISCLNALVTVIDGVWYDDDKHVTSTISDSSEWVDDIFDEGWAVFNGFNSTLEAEGDLLHYQQEQYHLRDGDIGVPISIDGNLVHSSHFEGKPIPLLTSSYSEAPGSTFHGPYQASMIVSDFILGSTIQVIRNFECAHYPAKVKIDMIYWVCGWHPWDYGAIRWRPRLAMKGDEEWTEIKNWPLGSDDNSEIWSPWWVREIFPDDPTNMIECKTSLWRYHMGAPYHDVDFYVTDKFQLNLRHDIEDYEEIGKPGYEVYDHPTWFQFTNLSLTCQNTTYAPTSNTMNPSNAPSISPTFPSLSPSNSPSTAPTNAPSKVPTAFPTARPTIAPTNAPSTAPTGSPTSTPSVSPTLPPSCAPSNFPTIVPSVAPTLSPTNAPILPHCERHTVHQPCCGNYGSLMNDACLDTRAEYTNLSFSPCSENAFIGNVTEILSSKIIENDDDSCVCEYYIVDCDLDPDEQTIGECMEEDCENGSICLEDRITSCCGFDYQYNGSQVINSSSNWICNNGNHLCPDLFDKARYYNVKADISYFYDGDTDEIVSRCQCKYSVNECIFPPTEFPTHAPTFITQQPSYTPTKNPTSSPVSLFAAAVADDLSFVYLRSQLTK